jgi:hypothetical protein
LDAVDIERPGAFRLDHMSPPEHRISMPLEELGVGTVLCS